MSDKYTGETLMHYAAVNCDRQIICKILEKDADIMIKDNIKSFDYDQVSIAANYQLGLLFFFKPTIL